jgi:FtsP/CotA-like multicopper oxidase with cupredoxin domain
MPFKFNESRSLKDVKKKFIPVFSYLLTLALVLILMPISALAAAPAPPVLLDPKIQPKFTNQLLTPLPVYQADTTTYPGSDYYEVTMKQTPGWSFGIVNAAGLPLTTTVWGYSGNTTGGGGIYSGYLGPTFEAKKGTPIKVKYIYNLPETHLLAGAIDTTIYGSEPGIPQVRVTPHLHGGEVQSDSDGHPETWWSPSGATITNPGGTGPNWRIFDYPNSQEAATLWYHDHALGATRLNPYSGLAGFYLIRDPADTTVAPNLPQGAYEVPIVLQDKSFNPDGSLYYPTIGINPTIHPQWVPEFFGNMIIVNGRVWPNFNVEPHQYRLRLLNGSQARFYGLSLSNKQSFVQIGTDGGLLPAPVTLTYLLLAPGERADILVDFSKLAPGTKIQFTNDAKAPYSGTRGAPPDPQTVGQIMQFTVLAAPVVTPTPLPATLKPIPALTANAPTRTLTLNEVMGPAGPQMLLLDGRMFSDPVTENPKLGTTEIWEIINTTADVHPIHLHLVQFQLLNRQKFQANKYMKVYTAANPWLMTVPFMGSGGAAVTPAITPYLQGAPILPTPNEVAWKDTLQMNPGEVTRILVRFTSQNGSPFPFDATTGPGYVWHCHILEHEENEMMRPYVVIP